MGQAAEQDVVVTGVYRPGTILTDNAVLSGTLTVSGTAVTGGLGAVSLTGTPSAGQLPTALSAAAASWQSPAPTLKAWQFDVGAYGAKGDGKVAIDGAITSGTKNLACATSTPFAAGDVGKAIMIKGAGAAGVTTHVTTITAFVDSGHVTVAANAVTTVASAGLVLWATDDTAAFQSAVNAAVSYAQAGSGYASVYVPAPAGRFYGIAGPLVHTNSANGQITLPIPATTTNKVTLDFDGVGAAATRHWLQTVPITQGSTLVSFGVYSGASAQTNDINANGNPGVICGPTGVNGYGTSALLYSNMMVRLRGLSILTTHSASGWTYGACNFTGMACAQLIDCSYGTVGTVAGHDFDDAGPFSGGLSIGLLMPANGNNDNLMLRNVECQGGYTYGLFATEHTDITGGCILYCWSGLCIVGTYGDGGTGTGCLHGVNVTQLSIEACPYHVNVIGVGAGGIGPYLHGVLDTEGVPQLRDTTAGTGLAAALGETHFIGGSGAISATKPTGMALIDDRLPPGPVTTPSYTLGVAQASGYQRRATVVLAGGTVTAVKVSALMNGDAAPAMTTIYSQSSATLPLMTIRIPPGAWWEIDGTVKPTTNSWVLD